MIQISTKFYLSISLSAKQIILTITQKKCITITQNTSKSFLNIQQQEHYGLANQQVLNTTFSK